MQVLNSMQVKMADMEWQLQLQLLFLLHHSSPTPKITPSLTSWILVILSGYPHQTTFFVAMMNFIPIAYVDIYTSI